MAVPQPALPGTYTVFLGGPQYDVAAASGPDAGAGGGGGATYRWQPGVSSLSAFPAAGNTVDDARLALDTLNLYSWDGSAWQFVAYLGGGAQTALLLPLNGGAPDSVYSLIVSGGAPDTVYTLILDGGVP